MTFLFERQSFHIVKNAQNYFTDSVKMYIRFDNG
jgi:hypothetical protein